MVSILGIGLEHMILIGIVVLVISFIFFRRYFSALIYDVMDGILSFLDNFVGGVGLLGLDIGDWVAAFIIFKREKKITGKLFAGIAAWEATNLIPFSFIPIFGEILEFILGFVPTVFISRVLFNKFRPAKKKEKKLEEEVSIAERFGINVSHEKKILKKARKIGKKAPVDELKLLKSKKPIEKVSSELREQVDNLIAETNDIIQYIANQNVQAPQYLINILQGGINQAGQLLQQAEEAENDKKNPDFETAVDSAMQAKQVIINAANEFDQGYQNEIQQNQMQR